MKRLRNAGPCVLGQGDDGGQRTGAFDEDCNGRRRRVSRRHVERTGVTCAYITSQRQLTLHDSRTQTHALGCSQ